MSVRDISAGKTWLAAVVVPPVGLVLLWMRLRPGVFLKLLASLGLVVLSIVYLFVFFGMRLEMDGSGMGMVVSFGKPEKLQADLEEHRAKQKQAPATGGSVQPVSSAGESATPIVTAAHYFASSSVTAPAASATEWPEFRGAKRNGEYGGKILTEWPSDGLKELWKQPVGGGYASFAVAGGRAFTIEQRRNQEVAAAYDLQTGRELWTNSWTAFFQEGMGGDGPRATPTWNGGRVYALGAEGELRAMDAASGKTLWRRNILEDTAAKNLYWGMAASPLIVDDKVIVLPGGRKGSVAAYNKITGEPVWTSQDDPSAYAAPMLATLAGRTQIVVVNQRRVIAVAPEDGALLWQFEWVTQYDTNSAQPIVVDGEHLLVSAGYDHGSVLLKISKAEKGFSAAPAWENKTLKSRFNSAVLRDGFVYGFDESIFTCIDARTGERKWKGGRYGYGQVLLAGEHLIVLTEGGEVALVRATPNAHEELAKFSAIDGKTWNHPAIADGVLLVRNSREMAAFKVAP